ncbi:amino acid ABC transporter permease [Sphingopyxis sp. 113P3]|jgi:amine acid ABC transporter, permease protein, 3-TM region, His/Glu/Gln/Arg/opine family|uniref:amino acid ABC transporter permease n=1 Tax=Sphingopyxis sp. (strain 113P3) TaxID=292913 RepID=UPI0006AD2C78|nr:amino acid ABC transporter permease [Sphingopyxis sp. 113P3]ALC12432.1 amino acid ABC transporter permease [Sphingopyxis sp. 113P3]
MSEFLTDAVAFLPVLARGLWTTVLLTLCALAVSLALGLVWALMGMSHHAPLRWTNKLVINTVRGIPIIVQLFCVYFVLPDWGIDFPPFLAGVIGLGIAYSVYQAENLRGGFESVDRQLIEAGTALGMSRGMITRRIVMPLGLRTALPSFGNTTVMLLKDSSIASTITVAELTRSGQLLAISTFKNGTVYVLIALLYLAASIPLAMAVRALEKKAAWR